MLLQLLLQKKVSAKKQCRPETCFKQVNPPFKRRGIILLVWSSLVSGKTDQCCRVKKGLPHDN